jgi:hypothetical protein
VKGRVVCSRTRLTAGLRLGVALWGDGDRLFLFGSASAVLWEELQLRALCSQARPVHVPAHARALCLDRLLLLVQRVPVIPALAAPLAAAGPRPGGLRFGFYSEDAAGERRCSLRLLQQLRQPHWRPTCCAQLGVGRSSLDDPTRLCYSNTEDKSGRVREVCPGCNKVSRAYAIN